VRGLQHPATSASDNRANRKPEHRVPAAQAVAIIVDFLKERFRRDVERRHLQGLGVLFELVTEIGCDRPIPTKIECLVSRYARIDPTALAAAGSNLSAVDCRSADYPDRRIEERSKVEHLVDDDVILSRLPIVGIDPTDAECLAPGGSRG
jgi:hypothetical protein